MIPFETGEPSSLKLDGSNSQKRLYSDSDAICNYELKHPLKSGNDDVITLEIIKLKNANL